MAGWLEVEELDIDYDGKSELIVRNPSLSIYLKPSYGGSVFALYHKPSAFNLVNTLRRYPEGYHKEIFKRMKETEDKSGIKSIHDLTVAKDENLKGNIICDWQRRLFLQDHFLGPNTTLEDFRRAEYYERGDFVNQPYEHKIEGDEDAVYLTLTRQGGLWSENKKIPVSVSKELIFHKGGQRFIVDYHITSPVKAISEWFGVELNISLLSRDAPARYFKIPDQITSKISPGEILEAKGIYIVELYDEKGKYQFQIKSQRNAALWFFPIETVSLSESGLERIYQETVLLLSFKLKLNKGESFNNRLSFEFKPL